MNRIRSSPNLQQMHCWTVNSSSSSSSGMQNSCRRICKAYILIRNAQLTEPPPTSKCDHLLSAVNTQWNEWARANPATCVACRHFRRRSCGVLLAFYAAKIKYITRPPLPPQDQIYDRNKNLIFSARPPLDMNHVDRLRSGPANKDDSSH